MRAAFFLAIEFIGFSFSAASYEALASLSLPSSDRALPRRFWLSSSAPKFSMMNLFSLTASSHLPAIASCTASSAYCERGLRCSLVSVFTVGALLLPREGERNAEYTECADLETGVILSGMRAGALTGAGACLILLAACT